MAFPVAAAVAAGASLLSSGAGVYAQGKMNKKTREWNEKMYGVQRADALTDWKLQNEYNSPAAQMERLKAAGLNPNLVYDNGATHTAQPVRSTDVKSWSPSAPDFAGLSTAAAQGISAYQDWTLQQEQVKNMEAQRKNMALDSVLKTVELTSNQIQNARSKLELSRAQDLYDTSISTANEQLRALQTGTDIKISQEVRDAAMHAPNLLGAFERVAKLAVDSKVAQQQLENLKKTGILQQMEINMRKLGLSYSDSVILRMLSQFAGGRSLPEVAKDLFGEVKRLAGDALPDVGPVLGPHFKPDEKKRLDSLNDALKRSSWPW